MEREGEERARWIEDKKHGGKGNWCIFGPCADHHVEVATGYKAVFIDTSPSHLPKTLAQEISAFPIKMSAHMQIVYVLSII